MKTAGWCHFGCGILNMVDTKKLEIKKHNLAKNWLKPSHTAWIGIWMTKRQGTRGMYFVNTSCGMIQKIKCYKDLKLKENSIKMVSYSDILKSENKSQQSSFIFAQPWHST